MSDSGPIAVSVHYPQAGVPAGTGARLPRRGVPRVWDWLRGTTAGLQVLAVLVGVGAGVGAVGFRWLIVSATWLLSGHADYSDATVRVNPHLPGVGG